MIENITIMIEIIKKDKIIQDNRRDLNIRRNKIMKREDNKINKKIDKMIRIIEEIIDNIIIIDKIIEIKIDMIRDKNIIRIIMMIRMITIIEIIEGIKEEDKKYIKKDNWY